MSTSQQISTEVFLANVRASGLLSDDQLADVAPKLPTSDRGRVVARALVELGFLTKFQAERILVGRTSGFQLGQYRILDQLGRGGMGRVFKAQHRTMNRVVALKVLAPTVMQSERARDLFLREVQATAQLNHPNIVAAYDANETDGRYYLVMEFVDGPNLEQMVRDHGPLPVSQACDCIRQAALGLQCAHERGMVHRDIKPANILVQRGGNDGKSADVMKINDFGLARLQAPNSAASGDVPAGTILTRENTVMGTPDYLSPEQARNLHKTDIRSDLYSLGCTFFYLLTGQVPFPGGKVMDKLIRHSTEKPQSVSDLREGVPAEVAVIVDRLLAKQPKDRFQTPTELAAALAPFSLTGSTPWTPALPPTPASSLDGSAETQAYGSDPALPPVASNELSALANTASNDLSPTPADTTSLAESADEVEAVPVKHFRHWPLLIGLGAVGLLGFLVLAGVLLTVVLLYLRH